MINVTEKRWFERDGYRLLMGMRGVGKILSTKIDGFFIRSNIGGGIFGGLGCFSQDIKCRIAAMLVIFHDGFKALF